jgi:hypothetical protein
MDSGPRAHDRGVLSTSSSRAPALTSTTADAAPRVPGVARAVAGAGSFGGELRVECGAGAAAGGRALVCECVRAAGGRRGVVPRAANSFCSDAKESCGEKRPHAGLDGGCGARARACGGSARGRDVGSGSGAICGGSGADRRGQRGEWCDNSVAKSSHEAPSKDCSWAGSGSAKPTGPDARPLTGSDTAGCVTLWTPRAGDPCVSARGRCGALASETASACGVSTPPAAGCAAQAGGSRSAG